MSDLLRALKSDWEIAQHGAMSRVPLYHQLYSVLKAAIMDGLIAHDAQLPTEQQLAATFDVSRITAKRAMDELANEQLITRLRGRGSHVIYHHKLQSARAPSVAMLENPVEMGRHSIVRVVSIEQVVPPADVQGILDLSDGEKVHKVVRVCSNEDREPYACYVSYTAGVNKGFTKRNLESTPRLEILRDNGIKLTKLEQVLSAENASTRVAEDLDTVPGAALISIRRKSSNENGNVVDIVDGLYNPKRFQYAMVLSLD